MPSPLVNFRADPPLQEAIIAHAQEAGCTVSEYLRDIARERVGMK